MVEVTIKINEADSDDCPPLGDDPMSSLLNHHQVLPHPGFVTWSCGSGGNPICCCDTVTHDWSRGVCLGEPRDSFPPEKLKTLLAFLFLTVTSTLNYTSLAVVHDRVPDRQKYGPLPDVILDHIQASDWALDVSEYLIIASISACVAVVVLHQHRFILARRLFFVLGLLYLMRSVTLFVTVLPVASTTYFCEPKANVTNLALVAHRVWNLMGGFGLSINGHHVYCGDYIYSGHTVMLTITCLMFEEYSPRRWALAHWIMWAISLTGISLLLYARGHYTIDVLIAYYVTTRLFWMYHTLANQPIEYQSHLCKVWWYFLFRYFEGNIRGVVPRKYQFPLPLFSRCRRKRRDRDH